MSELTVAELISIFLFFSLSIIYVLCISIIIYLFAVRLSSVIYLLSSLSPPSPSHHFYLLLITAVIVQELNQLIYLFIYLF